MSCKYDLKRYHSYTITYHFIPVGIIKEMSSPNSPHSALWDWNIQTHVDTATAHIHAPIAE